MTLTKNATGQIRARTFYPRWQVIVRTPVAVLDITKAVVAIRTHKSIEEPAGTFQITVKPYVDPETLQGSSATQFSSKTPGFKRVLLSDIIGPMDFVEIRFGRTAPKSTGVGEDAPGDPTPPPIMRGFVDRVAPQEAVPGPNAGQQNIIIAGRDYGKLFTMLTTFRNQGLKVELSTGITDNALKELADLVSTSVSLDAGEAALAYGKTGLQFTYHGDVPADTMMAMILQHGIDSYIKQYLQSGKFAVPTTKKYLATNRFFKLPDGTLFRATITNFDFMNFEGNFWQVITRIVQAPFNEAYYIEGKDAPIFVFRPTPFQGENRKVLDDQTPFSAPEEEVKLGSSNATPEAEELLADLKISNRDIVRRDVFRDDSEVINYFEVIPIMFQSNKDASQDELFAVLSGGKNPQINPESLKRYGFRPMVVQTAYFPSRYNRTVADLLKTYKSLPSATPIQNILVGITVSLCTVLAEAFKNTDKFFKGSLSVIGNENARIGRWLINEEQNERFYIVGVDHVFTPFERFDTVLSVVRGDRLIQNPLDTVLNDNLPATIAAQPIRAELEKLTPVGSATGGAIIQ